MGDTEISFVKTPGLILDRILTLLAHKGRAIAMEALTRAVSEDVQENSRNSGYTPRTLLWYVIGVRVSGDSTFHTQPAFVDALGLNAHAQQIYRVHLSAIDTFLAQTKTAT